MDLDEWVVPGKVTRQQKEVTAAATPTDTNADRTPVRNHHLNLSLGKSPVLHPREVPDGL
jgi:hypothetical protein